jgi:AcrR family transcriptional regulator
VLACQLLNVREQTAVDDLSPRAREILDVARDLLDEQGSDGLSMRKLADRLGMRAPSLYKHFPNKDALEAALISRGFEEQGEQFEAALRDSPEPLAAIAAVYRAYAQQHPHLYRLMYDRSLNRDLLSPGSEDRAVAPAVRAAGGDRSLARAIWAFAHGMTVLELNNRFPADADLDAAWERGLAALQASVARR